MTFQHNIESILHHLDKLRNADQDLVVFGASRHKYRLNEPLSESTVSAFEKRFEITLPEDYRQFLILAGDGGAGPDYGLETLEDSLYADLDYKRDNEFMNPAVPFPITEPWNMDFVGDEKDVDAYQLFEDEYFDEKWRTGLLRICNSGCGVYTNLVVKGKEYGHIWIDARAGDGGIYPYFGRTEKTSFIEWYAHWLVDSLREMKIRKLI